MNFEVLSSITHLSKIVILFCSYHIQGTLHGFLSKMDGYEISIKNSSKVKPQYMYYHGTIIRTGITYKKPLVICATQLAGSLLLKKLDYLKLR